MCGLKATIRLVFALGALGTATCAAADSGARPSYSVTSWTAKDGLLPPPLQAHVPISAEVAYCFTSDGLDLAPSRFATERTVSTDTTAAGGNASLLSLQEEV